MKRADATRILRFGSVGFVGFVVDALVLYALMGLVGLSPYTARIGSFLVAVTVTWSINRSFTFAESGRLTTASSVEYGRYLAVQTGGVTLNFAVYASVLQSQSSWGGAPLVALAFASLVAMFFNYFGARRFVFIKARHAD